MRTSCCKEKTGRSTPLPDYHHALERVLDAVSPLGRSDTVDLHQAGGRVLSTAVHADRDLPPCNRSRMDGYALRWSECASLDCWPIAQTIAAGNTSSGAVPEGQCVKIATGAPLPDECDTVIPREETDEHDPVHLHAPPGSRWQHVHRHGADARAGDLLLAPGTRILPHHLGLAAMVGRTCLDVAARPRVIILTTGDELRPTDAPVAAYEVRDSNGVQTTHILEECGAEVLRRIHVPDEIDAVRKAVEDALNGADLVVTVGGISAGDRDFIPAVLDTLGVKILVHGAAIQPGRPILVGTHDDTLIMGMPGNPVSALVCALLFAWPVLNRMLATQVDLPWRSVTLAAAQSTSSTRSRFFPAGIRPGGTVEVPASSGSGDLCHIVETDGIVSIPCSLEALPAGTVLPFLPWPGTPAGRG